MSEQQNKPLKKREFGQKTGAGKTRTKQPKQSLQNKSTTTEESIIALVQKIDDIGEEIKNKPLKCFEKEKKERLQKSYEKLIFQMVKQINNSRQ